MFKITAYKFISYILSNYAVDKILATVKDIYSYLSQRNTKLSQEFQKAMIKKLSVVSLQRINITTRGPSRRFCSEKIEAFASHMSIEIGYIKTMCLES
jgi:predicted site-specific integrase-resolvase